MYLNIILTSSNIDKIFAGSFVHFNVSLAQVMLVLPQRHIPVFFAFKTYQSFTIPPALLTETQRYAAPETSTTRSC